MKLIYWMIVFCNYGLCGVVNLEWKVRGYIFFLRYFNFLICIVLEEVGWWKIKLLEVEGFFTRDDKEKKIWFFFDIDV